MPGAILRYAGLWRAYLYDATLTGAYLGGAALTGVDLTGAYLGGVKANSSTICPNGKPWGVGNGGNCPF